MPVAEILTASAFQDQRGMLNAFVGFDLKPIVRMYAIEPANTNIIRAWHGHFKERKWFYAASGSFEVQTIPINASGKADSSQRRKWVLSATEASVLSIPGGYMNGFKALEASSRLLVFSDFDLEASKADDIRFTLADIPWIERGHFDSAQCK
jgi:dTDP-4-dehydrorhamnose 3,5-epimerase-like enzyme